MIAFLKRSLVALILVATPLIVMPGSVGAVDLFEKDLCDRYANTPANEKPTTCRDKNVPEDSDGNTQNPLFGPNGILTRVIKLLSVIVGIAAVIIIILAGLRFITSGSNPQDAAQARERVIYACVGLVVAVSAQILVRFVLSRIE